LGSIETLHLGRVTVAFLVERSKEQNEEQKEMNKRGKQRERNEKKKKRNISKGKSSLIYIYPKLRNYPLSTWSPAPSLQHYFEYKPRISYAKPFIAALPNLVIRVSVLSSK
jgi:hypothetical protein